LVCLHARRLICDYAVLGLLMALTSCSSLKITEPLGNAGDQWATEGRSGSRDRMARGVPVSLPIEEAWIYNAGAGFGPSSPLVVSRFVFAATRKGEVHAVDLRTGDKVGSQEFGRSIEGSPAVDGNFLYVPNAWGKDALIAFDLAKGLEVWKYRGIPIEAPLLVTDDLIVAADVEGNVLAFGKESGEIQWMYDFGEIVTVLSGPTAVGSDRLAIATELGHVVCLSLSDGEEIWRRHLGTPVVASMAWYRSRLYLPTTRGAFFALSGTTGETVWSYTVEDEKVRFAGAAVVPDMVIFGGSDGVLRALDPQDASTVWTFRTDGTIAAPPAVSGELVFFGAMDREFFAVGLRDGSLHWSKELRGRVKSAPAVADGFVVVLTEPRYIYAFANPELVTGL
jgi:outer membrane protein assembly factor BamB